MWTWPLVLAMSMQAAGVTPSPMPAVATPEASACAAAEAHQFDFWIGEWEVTAAGKPAGRSRIQPLLGGCAIFENWRGASGREGKSLNTWNASAGRWEQYWVDMDGTPLHLTGGLVDGKMVLSGRQSVADPKTGHNRIDRITWTPNADGSVRQLWESSDDDGRTWTASFDGLYRKAEIASPSHT